MRLCCGGTQATGPEVEELVPARHLGADQYLVLGTPGFVYGCAAGDAIQVDAGGRFTVVERGGNIAVHVYAPSQLDQSSLDALRRGFEPLRGTVEAPPEPRFAVVTVPAAAGFPAIEGAMKDWLSDRTAIEWFFGNVYDDAGRPLGWWDQQS